jgi:putative transposase
MSRPLRIEFPGAYYHVMNRGLAHGPIFREDTDREGFLSLVGELYQLWGIEVYAYCLMDTHYHLLLQTPRAGLGRAMRHLDGIYTQRFNRAYGRDGPLFRGRYKAIVIDVEEYFLAVARYIHQNPADADLVGDIDQYRWSSHRAYLNSKVAPKWLNTMAVLSRFGRGVRGWKEYWAFMHARGEQECGALYPGKRQSPILGEKDFVQWVKEQLGGEAKVEAEKPESRQVYGYELGAIIEATARVYGKRVEDLEKKQRGRANEARAMAMYVGRTLGGYKLVEIGRALGLEKYSSVSSACLTMKRQVEQEKAAARRKRQIERILMNSQQQT